MGLTRRDILVGGASLCAGVGLSTLSSASEAESDLQPLRVAHLTDIHLRPGKLPEESLARALHSAQELGADLIVNGGDVIFDALNTDRSQVERQWKTLHRLLKAESSTPWLHVVGNHDILGWSTPKREPGTKLETLGQLELSKSFYSVERGGWKIVVLDSIEYAPQRSSGYLARLGWEQLEWFERELRQNELPVCVFSHIPILSACAYFDGPNEEGDNWSVPGEWMHLDARAVKDLLRGHPQVKLCLSGHIHLVDNLQYHGVSYFCNGAVCGNYWQGSLQGFPPALALVELYPDGRFRNRLVLY